MWRQDVVRHTLRTRTTVQGSGRGDVYYTRGRPSGETALATAATPTRRTRADPSHQGSAGIGGLDPSPSRSVLRLGAGWSRAEYSGSGRDCGTGASGGLRARPSPRPEKTAALGADLKRSRRAGGEPPFCRGGSQGGRKRRASPKGLRRPNLGPCCLRGIDLRASKLITRSDEDECGFLLSYRYVLWTPAISRRYAFIEIGAPAVIVVCQPHLQAFGADRRGFPRVATARRYRHAGLHLPSAGTSMLSKWSARTRPSGTRASPLVFMTTSVWPVAGTHTSSRTGGRAPPGSTRPTRVDRPPSSVNPIGFAASRAALRTTTRARCTRRPFP